MSVTWTYIPAQAGLTIPEQWHARVPRPPHGDASQSVAVLRCCRTWLPTDLPDTWQVVMQGPDNGIASLSVTRSSLKQAQIEVEHALYQMGWR